MIKNGRLGCFIGLRDPYLIMPWARFEPEYSHCSTSCATAAALL